MEVLNTYVVSYAIVETDKGYVRVDNHQDTHSYWDEDQESWMPLDADQYTEQELAMILMHACAHLSNLVASDN